MAREFGRDEFRGGGMAGDIGQRRFALRDAVVLVDLAEQPLRARLVRIGVEDEAAEQAQIRASSPLLAEMQKWLDQNATNRSTNPQSAIIARCSRASASAR